MPPHRVSGARHARRRPSAPLAALAWPAALVRPAALAKPAALVRPAALALLAVLVLVGRPAGAIVNGAPVSDARYDREFPWAVALEDPASGGVCTAELIAPDWVLTAAHCTGTGLHVLLGHAERGRGQVLRVAQAVRHPRYDAKTGEYDVGLLRLDSPVAAPTVRLATAAEARALLQPGARAVIAGWGRRSASTPFATRLVYSDVELRRLERRGTLLGYYDAASGPCGGDSGCPLLLGPGPAPVLVGIASRVVGDLCAQGGGYGIYLDVSAVRAFVEAHVRGLP